MSAREDKGFGEEWQPSEYWTSTSGSAASSSWFDTWASPDDQPAPTKSKGVARSSERFGTASVGLPVSIGDSAAPGQADVNPDDPDAAHRHRLRDPVNRFSGFSAPPVDLPSTPRSTAASDGVAQVDEPHGAAPVENDTTSSSPVQVELPAPAPKVAGSPVRTTSSKRHREETPDIQADGEDVERFREFAGYAKQVGAAQELISLPILHSELFHAVGTGPPGGVLIVGPSGVGKTKLVHLAAAAAGAKLVVLNGGDVVSEGSNSSDDLKTIFKRAREQAPCVLFLDEVDALAPKTTADSATASKGNSGSARMVSQLLTLLDESMRWRDADRVIIVAATNRPQSVDPALRRAGRLDNEIALGLPDESARVEILKQFVSGMSLSSDVDVADLADITHGFTGADLAGVCDAAGATCLREFLAETGVADFSDPSDIILPSLSDAEVPQLEGATPVVLQRHFLQAIEELGPSGMREMRVECPNVSWDAVGGLEQTKTKLQRAIVWPLSHPNRFRHFGAAASRGVVLHGPPGCGKTLLAKAVATECKANFITVQSTDLLTAYVGESEAHVREIFEKARSVRPCVIFIDEVDAIATTRTGGVSESSHGGASDGVVSALLSELDKISAMAGVVVIGATNRLDKIDPALLRPGRLGTLCFVNLPDHKQRLSVLSACLRKAPAEPDLPDALGFIADATDGFSGADLNAICERAVQIAVRESIQLQRELADADADATSTPSALSTRHLEIAMQSARRSVSDADAAWYSAVAEAASAGRPLPERRSTAQDEDGDDDLASLQQRLQRMVEEVKEASRWERGWATAKQNTEACLARADTGDDTLHSAWQEHMVV